VPLSGGAWLLDTPGIKELQLWIDEDTLGESFPELAALAAGCRFRDCRHAAEPGCAVQAALREGRLPHERFASWSKLQREAAWLAAKQDQRVRAEQEARSHAVRMEHRRRTQRSPKR
jgi:ribosome biogenesis GTPase